MTRRGDGGARRDRLDAPDRRARDQPHRRVPRLARRDRVISTSTAIPTSGGGRSTTSTASGARVPSGRACGGTTSRPSPWQGAAMPGAAWFPERHAQLRRARARCSCRATRRVAIVAHGQTRAPGGDHVGAAGRRRGPVSRRTRSAWGSSGATASPRTCPTSPRRSSRSSPPPASARSGRRAHRSSGPVRWSTASRRSNPRCCSRSTATATARRWSTSAPTSRPSRPRCRRCATPCTCRTSAPVTVPVPTTGAPSSPKPAAARARTGAVRPPAVRALQLGHDRPAEGDRARPRRHHRRAPARRRPCTTTSAPATASSGSPPPAG